MTRFLPLLILLLLLAPVLCPAPASAQIPGLPLPAPSASPADAPIVTNPLALPQKTPRAAVIFDNNDLFLLTGSDAGAAQDRAELVNLRLTRAFPLSASPEQIPLVSVRVVGEASVIYVGEKSLLTVTQDDADAAGETPAQLASDWATKIETAFANAQRERGPEFLRQAAFDAGKIASIAALLTLAIWILAHRFFDRPGWPVVVLVWMVALNRIADLFPQTRPLHNAIKEGLLRPLFIVLIVALACAAVSRLWAVALRHFFPPLPDNLSPEERTARNLRRRATLGTVARVTGVTVIWIIGAVVALTWMGVNLPALLTSAGLIGVGIGLAAQDSMKDLVAGVNILIDDRFGVGDIIKVGNNQGTVEKLNLRITQIRDTSGNVITFPNRAIETVTNSTLRWSQVDFQVGVAYETDLRAAMDVLEKTAHTLQEEWPERILAAPQMLGVDSYNASDITLRMLIRTLPGDQWAVGRELRLRVKEAFDAEDIVIAFPQMEITVVNKMGEVQTEKNKKAQQSEAKNGASSQAEVANSPSNSV